MVESKIFRKKIFITFSIMILLILGSGVLGWIFTQKIEKSDNITDTVHLLKEAELQLRREEKNLLIRGYSQQRYLRWQKAKENFHQKFGELIGLKALTDTEINALRKDYSEMSGTYNKFFDEIRSNTLNQDEIIKYDTQFKQIGRKTLEMINSILSREQMISAKTDSQADILIAVFLIVFIATASFLIVNVLKYI
jgi:CHASE3 domain sensor protein